MYFIPWNEWVCVRLGCDLEADGGEKDSHFFINANRTELTARMRGCKTGGEAKASCNVNRMRMAYYF